MRPSPRARWLTIPVCLILLALAAVSLAADEGWVITRLDILYDIQPNGTIRVSEAIDVDFRGLSKHGIFRDVARRQAYDAGRYRSYDVDLISVLRADGQKHRVDVVNSGGLKRFKIGDPNRTVSGRETYRITYTLGGALNAQAGHDEFYWNGTGTWPVTTNSTSIRVRVPGDGIERVTCFEGPQGSTDPCQSSVSGSEATFVATRPLREGEQLTIVTAIRKGLIAVPPPVLSAMPRNASNMFETTPGFIAAMLGGLLVAFGGIGAAWWRWGRDRRFIALLHASGETADERVPLMGGRPVAVEFTPPEQLRPGQMGLLFDERADTVDITATIVDLAVRGYLKITDLGKDNWFSGRDWQLEQLKEDTGMALLSYERIILEGLFEKGSPTTLSELKNKFYTHLAKAKEALYKDGVTRGWFPRNPNSVRMMWRMVGLLVFALGVPLTFLLGTQWGAGLVGLPVAAGGLVLAVAAGAMPRRTALGQKLTRRTLGFHKYIQTAEVGTLEFAERAQIFTEYLPYAVAFKCVDRWAKAFEDLDLQAVTAGWYAGSSGFDSSTFASDMSQLSTSVSSTVASTPGGSGGSGFSGGSSGGGGGGGGGGSW